jgi:hypothetical protein
MIKVPDVINIMVIMLLVLTVSQIVSYFTTREQNRMQITEEGTYCASH